MTLHSVTVSLLWVGIAALVVAAFLAAEWVLFKEKIAQQYAKMCLKVGCCAVVVSLLLLDVLQV